MAESTSVQIEINLEDFAVPAAELLSDADVSTRVTKPYEIPPDVELFGEFTRTSAQFTVPSRSTSCRTRRTRRRSTSSASSRNT